MTRTRLPVLAGAILLSCAGDALRTAVQKEWGCVEFTRTQVSEVRYRVQGCGRTGVFDCMLDRAPGGLYLESGSGWSRRSHGETTCMEVPWQFQ